MAKSSRKRSRSEIYNEILSKSGLSLDDCEVMCWEFSGEGMQHAFHFRVMRNGVLIRLYDGTGAVARVVIGKGDVRARGQLEGLAAEVGGKALL